MVKIFVAKGTWPNAPQICHCRHISLWLMLPPPHLLHQVCRQKAKFGNTFHLDIVHLINKYCVWLTSSKRSCSFAYSQIICMPSEVVSTMKYLLSISIKRIVCLSVCLVCLCLSVSMHSHSFQDTELKICR